jgi:hypothetical protein
MSTTDYNQPLARFQLSHILTFIIVNSSNESPTALIIAFIISFESPNFVLIKTSERIEKKGIKWLSEVDILPKSHSFLPLRPTVMMMMIKLLYF